VEVPRKQTNSFWSQPELALLGPGNLAAAMPPGQFRMILSTKRQASSGKHQAPSTKLQAPRPALILPQLNDSRIIKEKDYENK
jgi:hypothetical protein